MMISTLILTLSLPTLSIDYQARFDTGVALVAALSGPTKVYSGKKLVCTLLPGVDEGFPLLGTERIEPTKGKSITIIEGRQGAPVKLVAAYTVPALTSATPFKLHHMQPGAVSMGATSIQWPVPGDTVDPDTLEVLWKSKDTSAGALDVYDEADKEDRCRYSVQSLRRGKLEPSSLKSFRGVLAKWSPSVRKVRFELVSNTSHADPVVVQLVSSKELSNLRRMRAFWQSEAYVRFPKLVSVSVALEYQQRGMRTAAYQALGKPKASDPKVVVWLRRTLSTFLR